MSKIRCIFGLVKTNKQTKSLIQRLIICWSFLVYNDSQTNQLTSVQKADQDGLRFLFSMANNSLDEMYKQSYTNKY